MRGRILLLTVLVAAGCADQVSSQPPLTAEMPLHLEQHLDAAVVVGSQVPEHLPEPVEWRFDKPQPEWSPLTTMNPDTRPVKVEQLDDALRLTLDDSNLNPGRNPRGGVVIDLPDWGARDWGYVVVRARSSEAIVNFSVGFNQREVEISTSVAPHPYEYYTETVAAVNDDTVQSYVLSATADQPWEGTWQRMGLWIAARGAATFDLLSVSVIPVEAGYASAPLGVSMDPSHHRRALYSHAPGRIDYRVSIPTGGRLDVGLRVLRESEPVRFRVLVGSDGDEPETVLDTAVTQTGVPKTRSVDLAPWAGQTVTLSLQTDAEHAGSVALWTAPTLSGARTTDLPNIIFYVIDGSAADHMSVYGYNRRTTPNLERLAAEGAVFEHAYSNASWTRPSTPSFLSSLLHSTMGGLSQGRNAPPEEVLTLPEHLHESGYQTALFTTNPNAGTMSDLHRGVDIYRDSRLPGPERTGSSSMLHDEFYEWRDAYPGEPYWAHFQTTDVHAPNVPRAPFAGLWITPARFEQAEQWRGELREAGGTWPWGEAWETTGLDRGAFFNVRRDRYDETMASQDYELGRLIERLKARGEWERTLLIIGGDHSIEAGTGDFDVAALEELPPLYRPIFRSSVSRVPLIFVWPGRIAPGRHNAPVSMLDVLPTVLELLGRSQPQTVQGHSLAPLLRGDPRWEPSPVFLDEFRVVPLTGEFSGQIEVIDGRWGASLAVNIPEDWDDEEKPAAPLLLYDLWNDPFALHSLHEEHPKLVDKYRALLEAKLLSNQALGETLTRAADTPLNAEQLEALRALGYIQ